MRIKSLKGTSDKEDDNKIRKKNNFTRTSARDLNRVEIKLEIVRVLHGHCEVRLHGDRMEN